MMIAMGAVGLIFVLIIGCKFHVCHTHTLNAAPFSCLALLTPSFSAFSLSLLRNPCFWCDFVVSENREILLKILLGSQGNSFKERSCFGWDMHYWWFPLS